MKKFQSVTQFVNFTSKGKEFYMFPNLLGQKAYHKLTDDDMSRIINVTRPTYINKMENGKFTPLECWKYMKYFDKTFDYLFDPGDKDRLKVK